MRYAVNSRPDAKQLSSPGEVPTGGPQALSLRKTMPFFGNFLPTTYATASPRLSFTTKEFDDSITNQGGRKRRDSTKIGRRQAQASCR